MKKKLVLLFVFIVCLTIISPKRVIAEKVTCSKINETIESYNEVVNTLDGLDCSNVTDNDVVRKCNWNDSQKAYLLSKLFIYNDQNSSCNNNELNKIISENKSNCTNVFGSTLKDLTKYIMSLFYVLAPFLLIIFGSLDFSKIVIMGSPDVIKKSRRDFFKRLTAFVLIYLLPFIVNQILKFNNSDYSLTGNVYSCKTKFVHHKQKWEVTYIPSTETLSYNSSSTWHTDWFQGDPRWSNRQWRDSSGTMKTVGYGGCGSLATSIVCAHYLGDDSENSVCYPLKTADEYYNHNLQPNIVNNAITTFFNNWHPEIGVTATLYSGDIDLNKLDEVLTNGGAAIAAFRSYTQYNGRPVWGGHYVTIVSGNQNSGYMVADSAGGHSTGATGISEWAPYSSHVFDKQYIKSPGYYYLIEKK